MTILTSRWLRWAAMRRLSLLFPSLGRKLNFPVVAIPALSVSSKIWENRESELRFEPRQLDMVRSVLDQARANDAGETQSYPTLRCRRLSIMANVDDCLIIGRTMQVLRSEKLQLLARHAFIPNWNQSKPVLLKDRRAADVTHYALRGNNHYYHFISDDIFPLLYFLRNYGKAVGPMSVVIPADSPKFVTDVLAALCMCHGNLGVTQLARNERIVGARTLWLERQAFTYEWMPVTRAAADEFCGLLMQAYGIDARRSGTGSRKLFVSRAGMRQRQLTNEKALTDRLAGAGFETFVPSAQDHRAQVETFRSASIVVAVHGAALTNLVFCRPGTLVIEIFPSNHVKSTYCWLSNKLGLTYLSVMGTPIDLLNSFSIDPQAVMRQVARHHADETAVNA